MATTPTNNVRIEYSRISKVPIDFDVVYNSGDYLKWDSTNHKAVPMTSSDQNNTTSAAASLGVAVDTQPITSLNRNLQNPRMSIVTAGLAEFTVDDNATYYPGDYVGIGSDAQKIVRAAGSSTVAIGVVAPENGFPIVAGGAATGIAATKGVTKLLIYLKPQFTALQPF